MTRVVSVYVSGALLSASDQFIFLAFHESQTVVSELRKSLLQPALDNVPVSPGFKNLHKPSWLMFGFVSPYHLWSVEISPANCVPMEAGMKMVLLSRAFGFFPAWNRVNPAWVPNCKYMQTATACPPGLQVAFCFLAKAPCLYAGFAAEDGKSPSAKQRHEASLQEMSGERLFGKLE